MENEPYMTRKKVILDLCSGLGGWTEAFAQNNWTVIRVENNPDLQYVPFTLELDVLEWEEWIDRIPHPEIIVASPPCREFSTAYSAPGPIARRTGAEFKPDLGVVKACLDIIDYLKPKTWVLENVQGAQEHFLSLIGPRRQRIGPFFLWGNFPLISLQSGFEHSKYTGDVHSSNPLRANLRALIPFEISWALFETMEYQTRLQRWMQ
tara:strand:- start:1025 stop:1645 length:621 start_codon:yes stop_codon:yes gene_type:complete